MLLANCADIPTMGVGKRIRQIRRAKDLSQEWLAEQLGLSSAQVSRIENEVSDPNTDLLRRAATILSVDVTEFFEEEKSSSAETEKSGGGVYHKGMDDVPLVTIPVYEHVHAGASNMPILEGPSEYITIPKTSDKTRFGVRVEGDSMEPVVVAGDIVVVSQSEEVRTKDLCLVNFSNGEYILRHVAFHGDTVVLDPANRKFEPTVVERKKIKSILRVVLRVSGAEQLRRR
jgi:repressor LexA